MGVRLVKLVRDPRSGSWKARKVIPEDVRAAYGKANEKPSWSATLTQAQAKAAFSTWLAGVEAKIDRLRQIATATPLTLSHREIHGLAGRWYQDAVARNEDDPGGTLTWEHTLSELEPEDEAAAYEAYLRDEVYDGPTRTMPWVADQLETLCEAQGLVLEAETRVAVLNQMHELVPALCELMIRRAIGDYGPDPAAPKLPEWVPPTPPAPEPEVPHVGIKSTLERYIAERQPAASTMKAWRRQITQLVEFLGHDDLSTVSGGDMVRWKDQLLAGGRAARTVRDTYLAAARTVFSFAVDNHLIPSNPVAGVTVRGPRVVAARDRGLTDAEAKLILSGTKSAVPSRMTAERRLAFRWVPWLCAYTGARVNEMTQLRKEDILDRDGVWVVRITPEAGSTKTGLTREVPLHSHLIEQGLTEVVRKAPDGPLFYNARRHRGGSLGNPQSKKVGEALARWVRGLGVADPNVAPNHGWRHRMETMMRAANVDYEARHVIVGHALRTESGTYGSWSPQALKREIEKLPKYDA